MGENQRCAAVTYDLLSVLAGELQNLMATYIKFICFGKFFHFLKSKTDN